MIVTFYSYKGGVGRSMALAHAADALARSGLRVLMVAFDLEAPGLEQYFPIDHKSVRESPGLFDLILRYKAAMSSELPQTPSQQDFRRLKEQFIVPVYPKLPAGGTLDLMAAGQRGTEAQLSHYALGLRQFDWQDFYFNFGGELFFEWLRRELDGPLYDVVLVDSRTGVTEMGGVCAYQLADTIVTFCAPNQQNVNGTHDVVRDFLAERAVRLRMGRPLKLLIVPARVETRDPAPLAEFRKTFEASFADFTPPELTAAGVTYWDLLIPYEPTSAFNERVVVAGGRAAARSVIEPAVRRLIQALDLLDGHDVMRAKKRSAGAAEPRYDITSRSAGYDVFVTCSVADATAAEAIVRALKSRGVVSFFEREPPDSEMSLPAIRAALTASRNCLILVGARDDDYSWRNERLRALLDERRRDSAIAFIPVLLPGARLPSVDVTPAFLAGVEWLRLEEIDDPSVIGRIAHIVARDDIRASGNIEHVRGNPYRGLMPFEEQDASFFVGREEIVERVTRHLEDTGFVFLVGASGVGKTSIVRAGVIPMLRRAAIPGSDHWNLLWITSDEDWIVSLLDGIRANYLRAGAKPPEPTDGEPPDAFVARALTTMEHKSLVVMDGLEALFARRESSEHARFREFFLRLATEWRHKVVLMIVARSDFASLVLDGPREWQTLIESNLILVPAMNAAEMVRAIEVPAQRVGIAVEPGLTDLILSDASSSAGVLPLLQAVLHALYDRSRQGYLTVEAYRAIGGLSGLLSRDAEEIFDSFDEATRQTSLNILTRLVSVMPDGSIVRRVAAASELSLGERSAQSQEVLNRLVQARLVAVSSQADSEPRYVLAHDALVRAWPRLQREIEREADWLRARSRLSDAVAHWEAAGRSAELLYPEIEINRVAGEKMPARPERGLNGSEVQFLEASRRRVRRRRLAVRAVVASFAMFAVMATVLAITASRARDIARTEAASSARVSEFLMSLFATADPTTNRGNNLTVRELLDRGATAADLSLATEPAIRSRLLTTMAQAYIGLGFYSPAGELLKQAEADQRAGGVPAEETVRTRVVLGTNYAKQGDYEAAERTLSAALALARASGVSGPVRSEALTRLAEVTMDTGRVEEAIRLSSEAVSAERARSPSDPLAVASSLNALGSAYYLAGQYSNAEAALRESLALRQRVLGRTDARTGESIASLASLLYSEQKLPEAIRLFREALNIYQLVYGPSHPEVGSLYFNMGVADLLVGNVAQAEPSLRRALEIRERSLGSDNRENIAPLTYLAMIDIAAKRLAIANAEVQRALDIARSTRRSDFEPPLDQVLISAADLARAGGERELANALLSQANAVLEQYYRPKSEGNEWRYARLDMVNASVLLAGGLTADARPILLDALAVFLRLYGPRGFFTKDAEERLASLDASPSADRRGPSARALSAAGQ